LTHFDMESLDREMFDTFRGIRGKTFTGV
jgi:hypothetical protein